MSRQHDPLQSGANSAGAPVGDPSSRVSAVPGHVWRGTAFQVAGRLWSAVCTLWILRIAGTELGDAEFGRFTFYLSLFTWLDTFVNLGTGEVAIQRTAAEPGAVPAVLAAARRIRVVSGLVGVLVVAAVCFGFDEPGAGWIALAACYPITHALELSTLVWKNRISWGRPVAIRALASTASLGAVGWLAGQDAEEPARYLVAVAVGSTLGNVLLHLAARGELPRAAPGSAAERGLFRAALPLGLSALCAQGYFYVDNLFVRTMLGDEALGPYNVAVRAMSLLLMLAQYATLSALPWLARCSAEGRLESAIQRLGPALFAFAGIVAGGLWPWTRELLELLVPGSGDAAVSLRWLLLAVAAIHVGSLLLTAVVASRDNQAKLWIQGGGFVLNVLLNFWAVPAYGIAGAGMTTFATETFVALGAAAALGRRGVVPFRGRAGLLWLAGPLLFLASAWISGRLPLVS
ncbi:MAG: lipopolysaccharide biosynthesis protein [Planctomycetes bacterium]|nr:lipopolysaccharide biosynthesis protein [Planctomycetota bacterium]